MRNILDVRSLGVEYLVGNKTVPALEEVSFSLERKEILGIVGESGSGKTTCALSLLCLLGDNARTKGKIIFEGKDLLALPERRLRKVRGNALSMVFQEPAASFNPVLSIEYQFKEMLKEKFPGQNGRALRNIIDQALRRVRLPEPDRILKSYPHQLSGGQLQRVAIAFAISCNPSVLIADEPTSNLDVTIESQIINLFLTLRQDLDLAIIFITHNLDLVKMLCDRVCVLYRGRAVEVNGKDALFSEPSHPYTKGLLQSFKSLE